LPPTLRSLSQRRSLPLQKLNVLLVVVGKKLLLAMAIVAQNALKVTVQIAVRERPHVVLSAEGVSAQRLRTVENAYYALEKVALTVTSLENVAIVTVLAVHDAVLPGKRKLRIASAVGVQVARIARTALANMARMQRKTAPFAIQDSFKRNNKCDPSLKAPIMVKESYLKMVARSNPSKIVALLAKKQAAAPTLLKGEPSTRPRRKLPLEDILKRDMVRNIEQILKPFFKIHVYNRVDNLNVSQIDENLCN